MREARIGTRGSALALAQASSIKRILEKKNPSCRFTLVKIRTAGDEFQSVELFKQNNIGVFTKEIEKKLLSGAIDIAVHSLKDLPTELVRGLVLGAIPKRISARDVLISRKRWKLQQLPRSAKVGTGSPRRKRQLLLARPDLEVVDLRGDLDTRIQKTLKSRELDAVVIAEAGLLRLKKYLKYARRLSEKEMLPAVGQGALGIQARRGDRPVLKMLKKIHHSGTEKIVTAERAFLSALRGGCRVPVGVLCTIKHGKFSIRGAVFSVKTSRSIEAVITAPASERLSAARRLAQRLLKNGAGQFLVEARAGNRSQ